MTLREAIQAVYAQVQRAGLGPAQPGRPGRRAARPVLAARGRGRAAAAGHRRHVGRGGRPAHRGAAAGRGRDGRPIAPGASGRLTRGRAAHWTVPSALPSGDRPPPDGRLPRPVLDRARGVPFGAYVHVPFCQTRCGYCDFNTYTATELGPGVSRGSYADTRAARDPAGGERPHRRRRVRRPHPAAVLDLLRRRHADPAAGRASRPDRPRDSASGSASPTTPRSPPRPIRRR